MAAPVPPPGLFQPVQPGGPQQAADRLVWAFQEFRADAAAAAARLAAQHPHLLDCLRQEYGDAEGLQLPLPGWAGLNKSVKLIAASRGALDATVSFADSLWANRVYYDNPAWQQPSSGLMLVQLTDEQLPLSGSGADGAAARAQLAALAAQHGHCLALARHGELLIPEGQSRHPLITIPNVGSVDAKVVFFLHKLVNGELPDYYPESVLFCFAVDKKAFLEPYPPAVQDGPELQLQRGRREALPPRLFEFVSPCGHCWCAVGAKHCALPGTWHLNRAQLRLCHGRAQRDLGLLGDAGDERDAALVSVAGAQECCMHFQEEYLLEYPLELYVGPPNPWLRANPDSRCFYVPYEREPGVPMKKSKKRGGGEEVEGGGSDGEEGEEAEGGGSDGEEGEEAEGGSSMRRRQQRRRHGGQQ